MRSGYVYLGNGYLRNIGYNGYYWPTTSGDPTAAYFLNFYLSDVYPTSLSNRFLGLSARCLASGAWLRGIIKS